MLRIFIIDDHPLVISGLKSRFRKDRDNIEICGSALDVRMALQESTPQRNPHNETIIKIDLLTAHQFDVVSLLSEGNSRNQIGKRLSISVSTIEKILTSVRKKFQSRTTSQLIWMLTHKKII